MRKALCAAAMAIAAMAMSVTGTSSALASETSVRPANTTVFVGYICDNNNGDCLKAGTPVTVNGFTNWYRVSEGTIGGLPFYEFRQDGNNNCLTFNADEGYVDMHTCSGLASQKWHPVVTDGYRFMFNDYAGTGVCLTDVSGTATLTSSCDPWFYTNPT